MAFLPPPKTLATPRRLRVILIPSVWLSEEEQQQGVHQISVHRAANLDSCFLVDETQHLFCVFRLFVACVFAQRYRSRTVALSCLHFLCHVCIVFGAMEKKVEGIFRVSGGSPRHIMLDASSRGRGYRGEAGPREAYFCGDLCAQHLCCGSSL